MDVQSQGYVSNLSNQNNKPYSAAVANYETDELRYIISFFFENQSGLDSLYA